MQKRRLAAPLPQQKEHKGGERNEEKNKDTPVRQRVKLAVGKADQQASGGQGNDQETSDIEGTGARRIVPPGQEGPAHECRAKRERQRRGKGEMPVQMISDDAAKRRTDGGAENDDHAEDPERGTAPVLRKQHENERHRERLNDAGPGALQDARENQQIVGWRELPDHAAGNEENGGEHQRPP